MDAALNRPSPSLVFRGGVQDPPCALVSVGVDVGVESMLHTEKDGAPSQRVYDGAVRFAPKNTCASARVHTRMHSFVNGQIGKLHRPILS